jgi:hypothetical protein
MGDSKKQDIRFVMPSDVSPHESEPLLTICGDLVCFPEKKKMISKVGILGNKVFNKKPDKCPCCNEEIVMGIEVIGTISGPLLWQCMKCDERFLKYDITTTNTLLLSVKDTYTVPDDWGYRPRSEFS